MEYSLRLLNKNSDLKLLTVTEIINSLNLIGFEVDEINYQKTNENKFLEDIHLLIKIPANRDDLLTEDFFKTELGTIFLLNLYFVWESLKKKYAFLLRQKYQQYLIYEDKKIESTTPEILAYTIELENLQLKKSPVWVKNKLLQGGISSKDTITDFLQLVNQEWGQAFNFAHVKEKNSLFTIQPLLSDMVIQDHDKKEYFLPKETIVLQTQQGEIINVLGLTNLEFGNDFENGKNLVVSGLFYNVHENLLELNSFSNRISLRNLRKSYLENFRTAFQRLLTLLEIITSVRIQPLISSYIPKELTLQPARILRIKKAHLEKLIFSKEIQIEIFQKAGLKIICHTPTDLYVQIPFYRVDLTREIDLIEEYSRFIGYKNFQEILPKKELQYSKKKQINISSIKEFFINHQFVEIVSNSLNNKQKESISIELVNPLNSDLANLRTELFSNLLDIFEKNSKENNLFEIGRVFKKNQNAFVEQEKIAGLIVSSQREEIISDLEWFSIKGFLENFLLKFGYSNLLFEKTENLSDYFHPTRSVKIISEDKILGVFGELHPKLRKSYFLKKSLFLFEFNLAYFKNWRLSSEIKIYSEYSKYPEITKDLSFVITKNADFALIKNKIKESSQLLKKIDFFDIYFDKKLLGKVNVGIRLQFQSNVETLTNELINLEITKISNLLEKEFYVEIR